MPLLIMKQLHTLLFIISLTFGYNLWAQDQAVDTLPQKLPVDLRLGVDISKPITSFLDDNKKGVEITGDFRIYKNYFVAFEGGVDNTTTNEDYLNFTTKGSYLKLGINYNAYENWKGMNNDIFIGFRYGVSLFSQTLNSYTPNAKGTYFIPNTVTANTTFDDLSAHFVELIFGIKAETFKNVYLGASLSFKRILSTKEPENFKNLYAPGFNRIFQNDLGIGFNYTIGYSIPLSKNKG